MYTMPHGWQAFLKFNSLSQNEKSDLLHPDTPRRPEDKSGAGSTDVARSAHGHRTETDRLALESSGTMRGSLVVEVHEDAGPASRRRPTFSRLRGDGRT